MLRRDFLKLTAAVVPTLYLLPAMQDRPPFIPYRYRAGYSKRIGTSKILPLGELVEINGSVYTVIEVETKGHHHKHPFVLLDRPLETDVNYDQPIVCRGQVPRMWFYPSGGTLTT